jgi:hypothetical protein
MSCQMKVITTKSNTFAMREALQKAATRENGDIEIGLGLPDKGFNPSIQKGCRLVV